MVKTIWGTTDKPVASRQLAELLEGTSNIDGTLYIGYPVIGTPEVAFPFDALLLGEKFGLVAFCLIEGRVLDDYEERLDESFTKLKAKLLQYSSLSRKREFQVDINTIAFAPGVSHIADQQSEDHPLTNKATLLHVLEGLDWKHRDLFPMLASAIQAISTIRKGKKRRTVSKEGSRGSKLKALEDSISTLDNEQSAAVIETVNGVQRIRGLAGSGKTIVLALKVAYLHVQHLDWKIAVTFNTRSLKGQFERLINTFVIEQGGEEPDWGQIDIIHAWGAQGAKTRDGIYYKFCKENGLTYFDFRGAEAQFGQGKGFAGACEHALAEAKNPKQFYDVIVVDEAQDLSPHFLRLCYEFLKQPKRLVYAYDELQSLTGNSLPSPEDIFGKRRSGEPRVSFAAPAVGQPRQDIILETCYRISGPVLATAHALGFGIYRKPEGLIQLFDQKELWLDVGYKVHSGKLEDGERVSLERTADTSPKFLEAHSPLDDLIRFEVFDNEAEQTAWLVEQIEENIRKDELDPEDIVVINPEPLKTRNAVAKARSLLFAKEINSALAGVTNSPDVFFENDTVTFTGVFRAKGNEAAMVYVINAQDCYDSYFPSELAKARNRLFTAITRSKAWVRVIGVGKKMHHLIEEFHAVR